MVLFILVRIIKHIGHSSIKIAFLCNFHDIGYSKVSYYIAITYTILKIIIKYYIYNINLQL